MRKAKLIESRTLSPSVRSLTLRMTDGLALGHKAGQYVDLVVPTAGGLPHRRSYSIASSPDPTDPDVFEIAVTRVEGGPTSEALHALSLGVLVEVEGPLGTFVRRADEGQHPALFVATGTGLAPFRAMLSEELRGKPPRPGPPLVLLFGCRTPSDVLWGDDLRGWEVAHPRFRLVVTLSRPAPEWTGLTGYVQRHARALADSLRDPRAYVCGLSAMVDDVVALLERDARMSPASVRAETYD
ncbi:MAG: FAD-dependent oxidoreductase [Polyangiaceae bacterium]